MPRYETPQVQSRSIDMRTLVASLDPKWRDPAEVYIFPNGRTFLEPQSGGGSQPPVTPPPVSSAVYEKSPGGLGIYYNPSADPTAYYTKV